MQEKLNTPLKKKEEFLLFMQHLKAAHVAEKAALKMRFFIPIFQRHPKVVMAEHIGKAAYFAKKLQSEHVLFKDFLKETEKRWNSCLYKGLVSEFYSQFLKNFYTLNPCSDIMSL